MSTPLLIGSIIFADMDQTDFTCPFEVLSRVPESRFLVIGKTVEPIRDMKGLILTPEMALDDVPQLDVLVIPGGTGVSAVMEDEAFLNFIRKQAAKAKLIFSICTGALIFGAAGLLRRRKATTHWASHHLLPLLGAIPQNERVVRDGNYISAAGVTAGLDAALLVASILCGEEKAKEIQLYMEYAPNPPFQSGTPESAPASVLKTVKETYAGVVKSREELILRITRKWSS